MPHDPSRLISQRAPLLDRLRQAMSAAVVGQKDLVDGLLIGLLCQGHVLIEGLPGLAKTLAVKTLAGAVSATFCRVQFTPDLLPADILGTEILDPASGTFVIRQGPIFHNLILADEINRAPSKVQSALLEAMQEGQVTLGGRTFVLPEPFLVLATQNPIEQEGAYVLPEAQVDRFMLKLKVDYPSRDEERLIAERYAFGGAEAVEPVIALDEIAALAAILPDIRLDERLVDYILDVVEATRHPERHGLSELSPLIAYGASPRATLCLCRAARARAFLSGRSYVTPADIKAVGGDVMRHRVLLSFEAEARDMTADDVVARVFATVPVP